MLVQDVYTEIADKCALDATSTADKTKILRSTRNQLKRLYRKLKLKAERQTNTLTTVANTFLYYIDSRVFKTINFRETSSSLKLEHMSREDFEATYPSPSATDTGIPSLYIPLRLVRASAQPTTSSTIRIFSSSASDITSYFVVIKGISGGVERAERLTLNGITPVVSTNSYTSILSVSKDVTIGTINVSADSWVTTIISLAPAENFKEYWEIRLHSIPDAVYSIPYTFDPHPSLVVNDEDLVPIPDDLSDVLVEMIIADVLFGQGDAKYAAREKKANALIVEAQDDNYVAQDEEITFDFEE